MYVIYYYDCRFHVWEEGNEGSCDKGAEGGRGQVKGAGGRGQVKGAGGRGQVEGV